MATRDDAAGMPGQLLTVAQVAERLQVHPETVRVWLRRGELPGALLSDKAGWRVDLADVAAFLAERHNGHGAVSAASLERKRAR